MKSANKLFLLVIMKLTYKITYSIVKSLSAYYSKCYLLFKGVKFNWNETFFYGFTDLYIAKNSKIILGEGFISNSGSMFGIDCGKSKLQIRQNSVFIVGENSGFTNTIIQCCKYIEIGNNVNIGAGCLIMDSNFHSLDWKIRADRSLDYINAKSKAIYIKDNVFIGARCIINKGVTIGERSIICAGSIVTCDIPEDELWGGNPAKFIKRLD